MRYYVTFNDKPDVEVSASTLDFEGGFAVFRNPLHVPGRGSELIVTAAYTAAAIKSIESDP